jgi:hypothetical protein
MAVLNGATSVASPRKFRKSVSRVMQHAPICRTKIRVSARIIFRDYGIGLSGNCRSAGRAWRNGANEWKKIFSGWRIRSVRLSPRAIEQATRANARAAAARHA